MADRERAYVNKVTDALLAKLRVVGRDGTQEWLKRVQRVEMFTGVADAEAPRPSLFIEVLEVAPEYQSASSTYREHATLMVRAFCEDPIDPSGAIQDLLADVAKVVRQNTHLGTVTASGFIRPGKRQSRVEQLQGRSGAAEGFLEIFASYITTDEDP